MVGLAREGGYSGLKSAFEAKALRAVSQAFCPANVAADRNVRAPGGWERGARSGT
jgi:hypothetical protein